MLRVYRVFLNRAEPQCAKLCFLNRAEQRRANHSIEAARLAAGAGLRECRTMFNVTRRQALAVSGGFISSLLAPARVSNAAVGNTLNIAYNVNLPSFDPNTRPSS